MSEVKARAAKKGRTRAPRAPFRRPRTAARLFAVQALYQIAQQGARAASVIQEFNDHRLDAPPAEGIERLPVDRAFFRALVAGTAERFEEIDDRLSQVLPESWPLARLDPVLLAILRAGSYELIARPDIPTAAAINDYLLIGELFAQRRERTFLNGVLDAVARAVRGAGAGRGG